MGVLEIFDECTGDISWVSWRYLLVFPGDIRWVFCRYFIGVLMILDGCYGDI